MFLPYSFLSSSFLVVSCCSRCQCKHMYTTPMFFKLCRFPLYTSRPLYTSLYIIYQFMCAYLCITLPWHSWPIWAWSQPNAVSKQVRSRTRHWKSPRPQLSLPSCWVGKKSLWLKIKCGWAMWRGSGMWIITANIVWSQLSSRRGK